MFDLSCPFQNISIKVTLAETGLELIVFPNESCTFIR
ncbi:hypothetical protein MNBD_GAMMA17-1268, partial [hydrothermal vent metagenome]